MGCRLELIPDRLLEWQPRTRCHDFGISEALVAAAVAGGVDAGTAAVAAPIALGAVEGAGGSALMGELTGKGVDPLSVGLGAATGGATAGLGPAVGEAAGIGSTAGRALVGGAGGLVTSEITGSNPLLGAAGGAATGLVSGLGSGGGTGGSPGAAPSPGAGGSSPVATAGISPSGGTPVDLTGGAADTFGLSKFGGTGEAGDAPFGSAPAFGSSSGGLAGFGPAGSSGLTSGAASGTGDIGSKIMGLIEKNPGVLLSAGVLGINALMGDKKTPEELALQQQAGEAGTMARTLTAHQMSGTLPPGLQSVVEQNAKAGESALRSKFASMGLSGSSMESQQIAQLHQATAGQVATLAQQLAQQGLEWSKLSAQEFQQLLGVQMQQDAAFQKALGSFVGGLAGARGTGATT